MQLPLIVLSSVLVLTGADQSTNSVTISHCLVSLVEEAQVPAQEAGVLRSVEVREGQQVPNNGLLGRIDDQRAQMQHKVADFELKVAHERAANDIEVRYAKAAASVAEAEHQQSVDANEKMPGTVPRAELRRLLLTHRRSTLQIEQSELDKRVAALESLVRKAEKEAAGQNIALRQIRSPLEGVVVKVYRHSGEWVQPGDPVVHVVRIDRLRIEGFLNAADYSPSEVAGRSVTVRVNLAHGRTESFPGKVVYVSPLVEAGGEFRIWADVLNREQNGHWLLRPGLTAEMTIHLK